MAEHEVNETVTVIRDQDHFLEPIFFKVDGTIFQVPRLHFERNETFSGLFKLPPIDSNAVEGSSEACPLALPISKKDFRALLRVLYPPTVPDDYTSLTLPEWTSVLYLSTMWEFDALRALAIDKVSAQRLLGSAAAKMNLGRSYTVNEWFVQGSVEFVTRAVGPSAGEMDEIGTDMAERIYKLREARVAAVARGHGSMYNVRERVEVEFRDILRDGAP